MQKIIIGSWLVYHACHATLAYCYCCCCRFFVNIWFIRSTYLIPLSNNFAKCIPRFLSTLQHILRRHIVELDSCKSCFLCGYLLHILPNIRAIIPIDSIPHQPLKEKKKQKQNKTKQNKTKQKTKTKTKTKTKNKTKQNKTKQKQKQNKTKPYSTNNYRKKMTEGIATAFKTQLRAVSGGKYYRFDDFSSWIVHRRSTWL